MSGDPVKRRYDASSRRAGAAATRDRICAAAERLFLADGYARTSIRAVAKAAGVAEATIYLAFPDKPALLDAVIVRATRDNASESLAAIVAAPARRGPAAPRGLQRHADGPRRTADRARRGREP